MIKIYIFFFSIIFFKGLVFAEDSLLPPPSSLSLYEIFKHNQTLDNIIARQKTQQPSSSNKEQMSLEAKIQDQEFNIQKSERDFFERLLAKYPDQIVLHYNFAWFFINKQKTISQFNFVLKSKTFDELRFMSAFNIGTLYGFDKKLHTEDESRLDRALQYYQMALDIKPDSQETKQNIEMLFLQQARQQQTESSQQDSSQENNKQQQQDKSQKQGQKNETSHQKKSDKNGQKEEPKQEFQSQKLSKRDVQDILEELKQQEQKIWQELIRKQSQNNQARPLPNKMFKEQQSQDKALEKDW